VSSPRKKITEEEASCEFVLAKVQHGKETWQETYASLRGAFGEEFTVQDEGMAAFDLFLASMACDIKSLKNLFPPGQANRIRKHILKYVRSPEYGDYAIDELREYERVYDESLKELVNLPTDAVAARLLRKWLGPNITYFEVVVGGKKTGVISPMLVMAAMMVITENLGWKIIKDNYELIEGKSRR